MTKEHHQLDTGLSEADAASHPTDSDNAIKHINTTLLVVSLEHATIQLESYPLFTKVSVNGRWYCFDHVTGRLVQEGVV